MTIDEVNRALAALYAARPGHHRLVLEAGAGSRSLFTLPPGASLLALDISHGQLIRNDATTLRVQGDLHRLPLAPACADVIVCFNVIEHLPDPPSALAEMRRCLAPGGALVLGFPNRGSLKGLVTRATPIALHRAWYRRIVGKRDRGEGHFDAFPTIFHPITAAPRLTRWLTAAGFRIVLFRSYDGVADYAITGQGWKRRLLGGTYYTIATLGQALTLGRWRAADSDILLLAVL